MIYVKRVVVLAMVAGLGASAGYCAEGKAKLAGVELVRAPLHLRVVDNSARYFTISDSVGPGMNGLASLIHDEQNKNIFATCGMNLEEAKTEPEAGPLRKLWNAPRVGPMKVEKVGEYSAKLTQKAAETSGLNHEIVFTLGEGYVDQVITTWPDNDIESSHTFYASYMNQVQNTSLYLRGIPGGEDSAKWLEVTSPGHGGDGSMFFRKVEPKGKAWNEFLVDNPVMRQQRFRSAETIAATERAGFEVGKLKGFDNFMFGLVDEYVLLFIFDGRDDARFGMWISGSGGQAVRSPAWDYIIDSGPQKAGQRRTFNVRLVYKRFAGVEDVLAEVKRFRSEMRK